MAQSIDVAYVFETEGANQGLTVNAGEDIDDTCYGGVITSQDTYVSWLQKHRQVFGFQIADRIVSGSPVIYLRRRLVNADLLIDLEIRDRDCIKRSPDQPAVNYTRADPLALPREVQISYSSFDREFAVNIQTARNPTARSQKGVLSLPIDFVLADEQARLLAFDALWRIWQRQLSLSFEYPDPRIEPGDIINVIDDATSASHFCLIETATTDKKTGTVQVQATGLLTSRGYTFDPDAGTGGFVVVTTRTFIDGDSSSAVTHTDTDTTVNVSAGSADPFIQLNTGDDATTHIVIV